MYCDDIWGKTSRWKRMQKSQANDPYSISVTGACSLPSANSSFAIAASGITTTNEQASQVDKENVIPSEILPAYTNIPMDTTTEAVFQQLSSSTWAADIIFPIQEEPHIVPVEKSSDSVPSVGTSESHEVQIEDRTSSQNTDVTCAVQMVDDVHLERSEHAAIIDQQPLDLRTRKEPENLDVPSEGEFIPDYEEDESIETGESETV